MKHLCQLLCAGVVAVCFACCSGEPTVVITKEFANKLKKYDKLGTFHEGLALAQRNSLWGYIDAEGNEVVPCIYCGTEYGNRGFDFSEGMAVVINKDGKYGFINRKGEIVVKPQFQEAASFSEGVAAVFSDGNLNFVGKDGKIVERLSNKYVWDFNATRSLPRFKNGVCEVHVPAKEPSEGYSVDIVYIDKKGNEVQKPDVVNEPEGYVIYAEDGKVGYKDKVGNIVVPAKYSSLGKFSCGVALATLEYGERGRGAEEWYSDNYVGIYGYVDLEGNETFTHADYDKIDSARLRGNMPRKRSVVRSRASQGNAPSESSPVGRPQSNSTGQDRLAEYVMQLQECHRQVDGCYRQFRSDLSTGQFSPFSPPQSYWNLRKACSALEIAASKASRAAREAGNAELAAECSRVRQWAIGLSEQAQGALMN